MSDHSGAVENVNGLDIEELYRLHIEDLPIEDYDPAKLNGGELHLVNTADGQQKRITMHNRIKADVFVPAGEPSFFLFLYLIERNFAYYF